MVSAGVKVAIVFNCISAILLIVAVVIASIAKSDLNKYKTDLVKKATESLNQVEKISKSYLPSRFALDYLPPRKYQYNRGTCWAFSIVGPVEAQYRKQGIEQGFLNQNEYVKFTEQAFALNIVRKCNYPEVEKAGICKLPYDRVAWNDTAGGEGNLLWEFRDYFQDKMFPDFVCPYKMKNLTNFDTDFIEPNKAMDLDREGDGVQPFEKCEPIGESDDEIKVKKFYNENPIRMNVTEFQTIYNREEIKRALVEHRVPLSITMPTHNTEYFLPCNVNGIKCDETNTTFCPPDGRFGTSECFRMLKPMYNFDGEFRGHHAYQQSGGHGMTLAGYNDEYVTKNGFMKGGYIIRNTWTDGVSLDEFGAIKPRGSHSIAYWMQEISEQNERKLCPNSENPRNWFQCDEAETLEDTYKECTSAENLHTAELAYQPVKLRCDQDRQFFGVSCKKSAEYLLLRADPSTDGLYTVSLLEKDDATYKKIVYTIPMELGEYGVIYKPQNFTHQNDDDYCGYYWLPYEVADKTGVLYGGTYVNLYKVTFEKSSYYNPKEIDPRYNYTSLIRSIKTQKPMPVFETPYPQPVPKPN